MTVDMILARRYANNHSTLAVVLWSKLLKTIASSILHSVPLIPSLKEGVCCVFAPPVTRSSQVQFRSDAKCFT